MSCYVHCLIFVEPEASLDSRKPPKGKETSPPALKKYALLPAKSVNHPFCNILTQNGISLIKNGQVIPRKSLKLKVFELFLDDNLSGEQHERVCLYIDLSMLDLVQQLLSNSIDLYQFRHCSDVSFHRVTYGAEEEKNLKALKKLLAAKVDVTLLNPDAGSFLHMAVSRVCHLEGLILLLLKYGACVNAVRKDGATPLHLAAGLSDSTTAKILLQHGACVGVKMQDGSTPLHEAAKAAASTTTVRYLLDHGAEVNVKSEDGSTPLHKAAKKGAFDIAQLLVEKGAQVNVRSEGEVTPLHEAAKKGAFDIARLLVEKGAQVNVRSEGGVTPLHEAASRGSFEIVQFLVQKGAEVTARTEDGVTPLHIAAGLGLGSKFVPIVEFFLQNGADIHATDVRGDTPLHCSIKKLPDAMKLLVQYGANINAENTDCETALTAAVSRGWAESYEYLLSLKPDVNVEGNRKAFHAALLKDGEKFKVLVKQMIQQGFHVVGEDASNPELLFGAIHKRRVEVVRSLLEHGANVHEYRTFMVLKVTPLHYAIRTNQPKVVQLLLDAGADMKVLRGPRKHERTPITDAAECGRMEIMSMLLARGAKVRDEPSLLHLAAKNKDSKVVRFLLEEGFHWNSKNNCGETPLSIAIYRANLSAVNDMVAFGAQVDISLFPRRWGNMFKDSTIFETFLNFCFSHPSPAGETVIRELFHHNFGYGSPDRRCAKILAQHLIKLAVVNEAVRASDLIPSQFFEKFSLDEFQRQCELEAESMKIMEVCSTNLTVYDVLTKNISQIACCARNPNFYQSLKSYLSISNCPIYGRVVTDKVSLGCTRRQLLDQGMKVLGLFWRHFSALPHDLKEFVISNLSNQDLLILIKCLSQKNLDK